MERTRDRFSALDLITRGTRYARSVGSALSLAARRWHSDDVASMAAAVSYYLALSLFPLMLLLISGVGMLLRYTQLGQDAEQQILAIVAEHCSPTLELQIRQVLTQLRDQSLVSGPLGLAAAVLAAIGVFYQFERAFDKIWRLPPPPPGTLLQTIARVIRQRIGAFLLLTAVGIAIVATLAANVAIGAVREWMTSLSLPGTVVVSLIDAMATMLLNAFAFAALYRWLPKRPVRWRDALRGGLLVSVIWEVGRQLLGMLLIGMRYTTAYGVVGSFIALLLWFYWGISILLFGAEYVRVLSRRHIRPLRMFDEGHAGDSAKRPRVVPRRTE